MLLSSNGLADALVCAGTVWGLVNPLRNHPCLPAGASSIANIAPEDLPLSQKNEDLSRYVARERRTKRPSGVFDRGKRGVRYHGCFKLLFEVFGMSVKTNKLYFLAKFRYKTLDILFKICYLIELQHYKLQIGYERIEKS